MAFRFWRKEVSQAAAAVIAERVEPTGVFNNNEDHNEETAALRRAARAQHIHDTMMTIRHHAMKKLPRVEGKLPDGAVMDGFDPNGDIINAGYAAQPNVSDQIVLWYAQQSFIAHQMCAIIATHWLVNKACSQMPRDAMRKGYTVISDDGNELDPKDAKFIERYDRAFDVKKHAVQFIRKGRIFGIRIAMFRVDSPDPYYYEKPFNIHGVLPGAYKGIVQVDPYWTAPMLDQQAASNPMSPHFYEPTYWLINGKKIHRSHLCIYINDEVMDFLKPSYIYGGVPLPQQIMERVYAAERTANEGPLLAMSKRTTIMKVNAAQALANKQQFDENMQWWISQRDNFQVKVVDKEAEDVEQIDTALADLDKIIMNQYQLVAAIARTPSTKLLGTQPTGFNATGEFEEASYHEECESVQEDMAILINRHHSLVVQSHLRKPLRVAAQFNPLDAPTEAERAETNFKKAQTLKTLFDTGAIDGADINEAVRVDKTMGLTGITPAIRDQEDEDVDGNGKPVRKIQDSSAPSDLFGAGAQTEPDNDSAPSGFEHED